METIGNLLNFSHTGFYLSNRRRVDYGIEEDKKD